MKNIVILGSTGSIGKNGLKIVDEFPGEYNITALSANSNYKELAEQIRKYKPKYAIRISTKDFGYNPETKIKSIPLYAVFLINDGFKQTE